MENTTFIFSNKPNFIFRISLSSHVIYVMNSYLKYANLSNAIIYQSMGDYGKYIILSVTL